MRLVRFLLIVLVVLGPSFGLRAHAQTDIGPRIDALAVQHWIRDQIGSTGTCQQDPQTRLLCALGLQRYDLVTHHEARTLLTQAIDNLRQGSEAFLVAGIASFVLYYKESAGADLDTRRAAFRIAEQVLDYLMERSVASADPGVHRALAMVTAQAHLEVEQLALPAAERTKWLTNLANSLVRQARYARADPEVLRELNDLSLDIRQEVVRRLEIVGSPVRLGRALLNLGNGYVQASQFTDLEAGRPMVDWAGEQYERALDVLVHETSPDDPMANRLLTTVLSMHGISMMRGTGDEYLSHRRSIALLSYARERLGQRISGAREIDFWLAEIGARIQLIDRLPIEGQQLAQVHDAIALFETHAATATQRRREPDTPISVATSGTSLYAFRGRLDRNRADCQTAKQFWDRIVPHISTHANVNGRNIVYPFTALVDCFTSIDPDLGGRHVTDPERIALKQRIAAELAQGRRVLIDLPILNTTELAAQWFHDGGGDTCAAAAAVRRLTAPDQRIAYPEFWALGLLGPLCDDDQTAAEGFFDGVMARLIEQERQRARSRSGLALLARGNRQPLTDLAIVLAEAGMIDQALWILDFRDRSRFAPRLRATRARMLSSPADRRATIAQDIETWLRHDNPTDLAASFAADGLDAGRVLLRSEKAAQRLGVVDGLSFSSPAEIAASVGSVARERRLAWLLIGTHRSGWLVSTEGSHFKFVPIDIDRGRLERLLARTYGHSSGTSTDGLTFFEARDRSHSGQTPEERDRSVSIWQMALADLSKGVGDIVVEPLLRALDRPRTEQPPRLTLIVRNELADLPLHAIGPSQSNDGCPSLIDCYLVGVAGHATDLGDPEISSFGQGDRVATFWGHSAPVPASTSLASYGALLDEPVFDVTTAALEAVTTLSGPEVGLWLVHGQYDQRNPVSSHFTIDPGVTLDGIDILARAPDARSRRLQILIGCDGALFDGLVQPTEQVGLAEPFLQIGVQTLILPAWNSEVVASRVFTAHLIRSIVAGESAAQAYRNATLFLRDAGFDQVIALLSKDRSVPVDVEALRQLQRLRSVQGKSPPFRDLTRFAAFRLVDG